MYDDKLICATAPPDRRQRERIVRFFRFYAWCKGWLNLWRARPGANFSDGWHPAVEALARARPLRAAYRGPPPPPF